MVYVGNELYHSGILNMKWGQRRYQYPDGTWTPEGKKRRRMMEGGNEEKPSREETYSEDYKRYKSLKNKKYKELSNEELNFISNRESAASRLSQGRSVESKYKNSKIGKTVAVAGVLAAAIGTGVTLYKNTNSAVEIGKEISFNMQNRDLIKATEAAKNMERITQMKKVVEEAAKNM